MKSPVPRAHATLGLAAALLLSGCLSAPNYDRALPEGAPALIPLGPREPWPDLGADWEAREEIAPALQESLAWLQRPHAPSFFPAAGISHERTLASVRRLYELLYETDGPVDFQRRMKEEFQAYRSAGWDGRGGGVLFTAYCTPILRGRLTADATYRYPLYALPPDLVKAKDGSVLGWETKFGRMPSYPSRHAIEAGSLLAGKGLELVWLADPIDAYIAHVNGSAFIKLEDGSLFRLGYAGKNGRPYVSLGRELEADGRIPRGQASLATIRAWGAAVGEAELQEYLHRNPTYVFFTPIDGNPHGSLDVPVTAERSLATDKTLFPRAAPVFVDAGNQASGDHLDRLMFDQDTGGAIRTAGRADIYLGIGPEAEAQAGRVKLEGQLYYFLLRE